MANQSRNSVVATSLQNRWNQAHEYVLQGHMFESVGSYSFVVNLHMLAGQSGRYLGKGQNIPTRYDFPEITELFQGNKIDWKYYAASDSEPDTEDAHVIGNSTEGEQHPDKYTLWNPLPTFPKVQNDPSQRSTEQTVIGSHNNPPASCVNQ